MYKQDSAGDKGTLYQLRTILDRRNVVTDPKSDFNACEDFLEVVINGYILAALCTLFGVNHVKDITKEMLFPSGLSNATTKEDVCHAIVNECIAAKIEDRYTKYTGSSVPPTIIIDGVFNYSCLLLSMGLLARNFKDCWKERDGPRSIRMWKFLMLHFKESRHPKYAYEAFQLLGRVNATLTPKQAFELTWNRFCSTRNGLGNNKPMDLHMEHLNRVFKDNIHMSHSHLTTESIHKAATASTALKVVLDNFDKAMHVKPESGNKRFEFKKLVGRLYGPGNSNRLEIVVID